MPLSVGRTVARGLKVRERECRSWEGEAPKQPPPHQLQSLGYRYKLPQRGLGRRPGEHAFYAIRVEMVTGARGNHFAG